MSDHVVLYVDRLTTSSSSASPQTEADPADVDVGPSCSKANEGIDGVVSGKKEEQDGEEEPLIQAAECRICQEEDSITNLETPCACSGSLKV